MVTVSDFSSNVGHYLGYSVVVSGDATAVWFVETFFAEDASFGYPFPFLLWYRGAVVVVEFGDVVDGVGVVGGCFQLGVLDVVASYSFESVVFGA